MTKFKYENRGGRGFRTFHPFSNLEQKRKKKEEKNPTKSELQHKDIKSKAKLKRSPWKVEDISYKKIGPYQAIKILVGVVSTKSEIYPLLKSMRKNKVLFAEVLKDIDLNYKNVSTSALKITLEQNKDRYKLFTKKSISKWGYNTFLAIFIISSLIPL